MLALRNIQQRFDDQLVLKGINVEIPTGEILCLLGPSGCGKTTLLRVIAGLQQPNNGDVIMDGQQMNSIPVHQRQFGLMFQDFALFPHMNVLENVSFGLKMRNVAQDERRQRAQTALELVGMVGLGERDVSLLSGGEQQRVALARSLAPQPRLLLLDEPLGSLDAGLRNRLVVELRQIIKQTGLTALYVTHDQQEAYAIGDRIAVMNAGRIEQVDTPETIYRHPITVFKARFLGLTNIVPIIRRDEHQTETVLGAFPAVYPGEALLLHPDGIEIVNDTVEGIIQATVEKRVFLGDRYRIEARHVSGLIITFFVAAQKAHVPGSGEALTLSCAEDMIMGLDDRYD